MNEHSKKIYKSAELFNAVQLKKKDTANGTTEDTIWKLKKQSRKIGQNCRNLLLLRSVDCFNGFLCFIFVFSLENAFSFLFLRFRGFYYTKLYCCHALSMYHWE